MAANPFPVDCGRNRHQGHVHVVQAFRMTYEDVPIIVKLAGEFCEQFFLRRPIEIDDDVAAENNIRLLGKSKIFHQVEPPELDGRA